MELGRNEPCRCGSGRKYKKCHWVEDREARAEKLRRTNELAEPRDVPATFSPGFGADGPALRSPDVIRRVEEVEDALEEAGIEEPSDFARDLEAWGYREWVEKTAREEAPAAGPLHEAFDRLFETDEDPAYPDVGQDAYEARRRALAEPLRLLCASDDGLRLLRAAVHSDSWACVLAIEELADLPSSEVRDRAVLEALFYKGDGDWAEDTAATTAPTIDASRRLALLSELAARAEEALVELQGDLWLTAFEVVPDALEEPMRPTPDLGEAFEVLLRHGHHMAVYDGVVRWLDPTWDGEEGVVRFLADPGVRDFLAPLAERPRRPPVHLREESLASG